MPKQIDGVPISVTRTRRTQRYEIIFNDDGSLNAIIAHRVLHTTLAGVDVSTPIYVGTVRIAAVDVPNAVKLRLVDIETQVDAGDSGATVP